MGLRSEARAWSSATNRIGFNRAETNYKIIKTHILGILVMNSLYYHFKIFRSICHVSPLNLVVPIKIILGRVTKNGFEVSIHFCVVVCFREARLFFTRNIQKNKKGGF